MCGLLSNVHLLAKFQVYLGSRLHRSSYVHMGGGDDVRLLVDVSITVTTDCGLSAQLEYQRIDRRRAEWHDLHVHWRRCWYELRHFSDG